MNAKIQTRDDSTDEVEPLRKRQDGELYARPAAIEDAIAGLMRLTKAEFVHRIEAEDSADSVPSECLLYFVRRPPFAADQAVLRVLFTAIRQRVLKAVPVPTRHIAGKKAENAINLDIRDAVLAKFQEMLCKDRQEYVERLDFFECRFNSGVDRLRSTARRDICKDAAHLTPLVHDNESNEPHPEVERALSCITDSFDGPETDFLYRSKIHAAISSLPLDQRRVVELFLKEIPIDPQGTDTMTMVKILGCCEKTVRNRLKRAFARLAELLKEEDA
jgi:DNA-directed RNA polymerase specialized sigma24 family protein